ncbi:MAG: hypothetical protein CVV32_00390 [Methanomicrobiales archaeon HGW-Methanomicrobiales-3]|nr:MAG: hypothetical protein CVV32_00390 [Methanomicrobiales archaeon HGW-Methanomicrobiales-3]
MTKNDDEISTAGSSGIRQRRSSGVAGPSCEVSQTDHRLSGTNQSKPDKDTQNRACRNAPANEPVQRPAGSVFRKTELYGTVRPSTPDEKKRTRKRILQKLNDPADTLSCRQFETAFRDLIGSILEHQNLAHERMLLYIADLEQQVVALEHRLETMRQTPSGDAEVTG